MSLDQYTDGSRTDGRLNAQHPKYLPGLDLEKHDADTIQAVTTDPKRDSEDVPEIFTQRRKHRHDAGRQKRHIAVRPTDQIIISPEANMMQLYQTFVDLYLPRVYADGALRSIWAAAPSSPALYSAIRSVSLMLVHRDSNDERLYYAANPEYSNALRDTRQELRRKDPDKYAIVGMSHMLSLCELFNDLTINATSNNIHHVHWMIAFIESYRAEPLDADVRQLLASGIRWYATWGVLLSRKAVRGFRLRQMGYHEQSMDSVIIRLGDLTLATTAVLEECDLLCTQYSPEQTEILAVLDRLIWLQGELHRWMSKYYTAAPPHRSLFWYTSANTSAFYPGEHKIHGLFTHMYEFRGLATASAHISFWMCQSMLIESRMTILKTFHSELDNGVMVGNDDLTSLRRMSDEYADSICMSMPFMGKPKNGWAGRIVAIRPLSLLLAYYRDRRDWQKLSWCVQCATDLQIYNACSSSSLQVKGLP